MTYGSVTECRICHNYSPSGQTTVALNIHQLYSLKSRMLHHGCTAACCHCKQKRMRSLCIYCKQTDVDRFILIHNGNRSLNSSIVWFIVLYCPVGEINIFTGWLKGLSPSLTLQAFNLKCQQDKSSFIGRILTPLEISGRGYVIML